jgi:hypothetical protein
MVQRDFSKSARATNAIERLFKNHRDARGSKNYD